MPSARCWSRSIDLSFAGAGCLLGASLVGPVRSMNSRSGQTGERRQRPADRPRADRPAAPASASGISTCTRIRCPAGRRPSQAAPLEHQVRDQHEIVDQALVLAAAQHLGHRESVAVGVHRVALRPVGAGSACTDSIPFHHSGNRTGSYSTFHTSSGGALVVAMSSNEGIWMLLSTRVSYARVWRRGLPARPRPARALVAGSTRPSTGGRANLRTRWRSARRRRSCAPAGATPRRPPAGGGRRFRRSPQASAISPCTRVRRGTRASGKSPGRKRLQRSRPDSGLRLLGPPGLEQRLGARQVGQRAAHRRPVLERLSSSSAAGHGSRSPARPFRGRARRWRSAPGSRSVPRPTTPARRPHEPRLAGRA